ncbi:MAG TPA: glycosyltransferase [Gemmatimonadales bacterium]|nr:glycosyltransferase [Gemmatimonadales bacterium]
MRVALYFHGRLPVHGYGGTQRVVVWLARGLAELGHQVTLLAPEGSHVPEATLIALDPSEMRRPGFGLTRFLPDSVDILHAHAPLSTPPPHPHVFTLHGNLGGGRSPPPNTIFVSADHARRHGGTAFVYNGVDPSEFVFSARKSDYDLFLGRLRSVKGYRWAIEGARRTGRRLVVAGGWRLSLHRGLRFVGSVDGPRKADLLAQAACLWMPALWDEPFGLTLVEAMMSGTPVLGTRRGALPEIVTKEVGALGDTLDDLVRLRDTITSREPKMCRTHAERWFSHRVMAQEYLGMYRQFLNTRTLPPGRRIT